MSDEYEWVEDRKWTTLASLVENRRCRSMLARVVCGRPAVAALNRGRRDERWWAYCEDHLSDRRIQDGVVQGKRRIRS